MDRYLLSGNIFEDRSFIEKSKDINMKIRDGVIERQQNMIRDLLTEKLPTRYYISNEATVLIWKDGTKTIVRKQKMMFTIKGLRF